MSNIHSIVVIYKRTTQNGICKFIGENKERISIFKESLEDIELIEGQSYLLKIFQSTWEAYLTLRIGVLRNLVSIDLLD